MRRHAVLQGCSNSLPDQQQLQDAAVGGGSQLVGDEQPRPNTDCRELAPIFRPDWLEVRDGYDFCSLCNIFATDGHLSSAGHRKKLDWHEWMLTSGDAIAGTSNSDGPAVESIQPFMPQPAWIEDRGGFRFCTLCNIFATDGHLASEKHQRRVEWYDSPDSGFVADPNGVLPQSWGDPAHFERRQNWWWCKLCGQWADALHIVSKRHKQRVGWGDWYLSVNGSSLPAITSGHEDPSDKHSEPPEPWGPGWAAASPPVPAPHATAKNVWHTAYSDEHGRPYFFNSTTGERVWELPVGCAAVDSAEPQAASGPASNEPAKPEDSQILVAVTPSFASTYAPAPDPIDVPVFVTSDGTPWQREWSTKHQQHYFWNDVTGESRWELPDVVVPVVEDVQWC